MNNLIPRISTGLFVLIIACFFMPFVIVSCGNQPIVAISGMELATGTAIGSPKVPSFNSENNERKLPPEPLASLALGAACAGTSVGFLRSSNKHLVSSIIGGIGTTLRLAIKLKIDSQIQSEGQGIILVEYAQAFWLSFLSFLSITIANVYAFTRHKRV